MGSPIGGCSPHLHLALEVQVHAKNQIFWLAHPDILNMKTMLRRRNLNVVDNDVLCILCADRCEEDVDHLFFACQFSKRC